MIKLGVIGCARLENLAAIFNMFQSRIKITELFDTDVSILYRLNKTFEISKNCISENSFFFSDNIDAVYIASPAELHFSHTLKALEAGKHVLCEVPIVNKVEDGKLLLKISNSKNIICMMAENYCFTSQNLALQTCFQNGLFGDISFVRTSYIHDCKPLSFKDKFSDELTWRGLARTKVSGNDYPTHSIGPVFQLLKMNNNQFKLKSIRSFASPELAMSSYYKEKFSIENQNKISPFKRGDHSISIIKDQQGTLIELLLDTVSNRPSNMIDLYIQGLNACFISGRFDGEPALLSQHFVSDLSSSNFETFEDEKYLTDEDSRLSKKLKNLFPFYKLLENFADAVEGIAKPKFSFEESLVWCSIIEYSKKSLINNSEEIYFE